MLKSTEVDWIDARHEITF